MGVERKSRFISPESLRTSAYIEGGHALVALKTPGSVPVHKMCIWFDSSCAQTLADDSLDASDQFSLEGTSFPS